MTTQTTNHSALNIFRTFFGKALVLALLLGVMSVAASAQTNRLYYQQGGGFYGTVTVISGSHFEIYTNGTVIKTFRNSCRNVNSGGVAGVLCTFGQWDSSGRHIYSGQGYFFQNGIVYLRWTNENMAGQWRQINGAWVAFRP